MQKTEHFHIMISAANGTSGPDGSSTEGLSIIQTSKKLILRWNKNPFNLTTAVLWRGVYIPIRIKSFIINYGEMTTATLDIKGKEFSRSMTKYKYMGGSNGYASPEIIWDNHTLAVNVTLYSLELFDIPEESGIIKDNIVSPFKVFNQS